MFVVGNSSRTVGDQNRTIVAPTNVWQVKCKIKIQKCRRYIYLKSQNIQTKFF
jgi:hypothetical protein